MRVMTLFTLLLATILLSACAPSRWDAAYSVVDPGTPFDVEVDIQ